MMSRLLFVCLAALVVSGTLSLGSQIKNQEVEGKLNAYVETGRPTGLSYGDYEAAYKEMVLHNDAETMERLRQRDPEFRLYQDLFIIPMSRWQLSANDDDVFKRAYVKRIEHTYKRFWPAYVEHKSVGGSMFNGVRFLTFTKILRKIVNEKPTIELWRQCAQEYKAIQDKVEDVVRHEDVYDQLDELEYKLNYLNNFTIRYIMEHYADLFNKCETTEEMMPIIESFRRKFRV